MYGCVPCPKCGSEYRWPQLQEARTLILCDDCGYEEVGHLNADGLTFSPSTLEPR